jgi:hypothetical protein
VPQQEVSMINIPTLYFYRYDLYIRSHAATSISRENPQISINLHSHFSCIHQNPTIHRNKTYLLNQWIDLMYLNTVDLPRSLILESITFASSPSQVYMALPICTHPNTLPARIHMHPNTLSARVHLNMCTP